MKPLKPYDDPLDERYEKGTKEVLLNALDTVTAGLPGDVGSLTLEEKRFWSVERRPIVARIIGRNLLIGSGISALLLLVRWNAGRPITIGHTAALIGLTLLAAVGLTIHNRSGFAERRREFIRSKRLRDAMDADDDDAVTE